jgi:hypothetical protein
MMDFLVLFFVAVALWGWMKAWGNNKLIRSLKEELSDQRGINSQLNMQWAGHQEILNQPNPEVAQLRAQLGRCLEFNRAGYENLEAERRSNASLRGQITKIKGKA